MQLFSSQISKMSFTRTTIFFIPLILRGCLTEAAPEDWEGVYDDSVFGGNLTVCVTLDATSGVYYGQGKISEVGYIRGVINPSTDVWSGDFCLAGREARSGSFSVVFTGSDYSGTFTERPNVQYEVSGSRITSSTPSDMDCFKSDVSALRSSAQYDFTGYWLVDGRAGFRNIHTDISTSTESYGYGDEFQYSGFASGSTCMGGQVISSNWVEGGSSEGMYLMVAQNENTLYSLWWAYATISNFDIDFVDQGYFGQSKSVKESSVLTFEEANINNCLILTVDDDEDACFEAIEGSTGSDGSSENDSSRGNEDDDDDAEKLLIAILSISCAVLVVALTICVVVIVQKKNTPMAAKSDSSSIELH